MIAKLTATIARAVDGDRACQFARTVNEHDRWFTNSAFLRSADWIRQQLAEAGMVDAEVVHLPADGRTRMQDWTMPLAWDCDHAELRVVSPTPMPICSRQEEPRCVAQWSGPTNGPIQGPLHLWDASAPPPPQSFALTEQHPSQVLAAAAQAGVAALISFNLQRGYPDHRTMWCNNISPEGGWGLLAGQPSVPIFIIPPRLGRQLREMLATHGRVELAGQIDARLYAGTMPVATALLAGRDYKHEVLVFGHGFESGAIDNASGVGAILEAAHALGQLVASGQLPPPRRSIRWLATNECYGTVGLLTKRPQIARRGFIGLNLDTVGDASRPDYPFTFHRVGAASPSVANALAGLILPHLPPSIAPHYHWRYQNEIPTADHMMTDPMVGIVSPWLGRGNEFPAWHCSDDVPDLLDPTSMAGTALFAATYGYFLAAGGDNEAAWLAQAMIPLLHEELQSRLAPEEPQREPFWRWALKRHLLQAARLAVTPEGRERVMEIADAWPAEEFAPQGAPLDDPRGASLSPLRKTWGTLTFESVPLQQRTFGSPRWNQAITTAWYWADGTRTIAQIAELVQLELGGKVRSNLTALFDLAASAGLCELRQQPA